jgi:putative transposase
MPDHGSHWSTWTPRYGINRLVTQIKARSSRLLRQEFHTLCGRLPTL